MKSIFYIIIAVLINFTFLSFNTSFAALYRPPSETLSLEQYRALVKLKVSEVPDLSDLWTWTRQNKLKNFYFGGGAFRGLLLWINTNLDKKGVDWVLNARVPGVSDLLIQKDADRDIYAPDEYVKSILGWNPYKDWDVLGETFYKDTINSRGATLDKVRANPNWIEDPLNGFEQIYRGTLDLDITAGPFLAIDQKNIFGDNWLALTLRYLRFTQDLKDIADPSPGVENKIKTLVSTLGDQIPFNEHVELVWPKENKLEHYISFRIRKALSKFFTSTKKDPVQFLKLLKRYKLLDLLASRNFVVVGLELSHLGTVLKHYQKENSDFTFKDLWFLCRLYSNTIDRSIDSHKLLLAVARTNEETAMALTMFRGNPSEGYRDELSNLLSNYVTESTRHSLSVEHAFRLTVALKRIPGTIVLKKLAIKTATSTAEVLAALSTSDVKVASKDYINAVQALAIRIIPEYLKLCSSADDILKMEKVINRVDEMIKLKANYLSQVKSPKDFLQLLEPAVPDEAYKKAISQFASNNNTYSKFLSLSPLGQEAWQYSKIIDTVNATISFKREYLASTTNKKDFIDAIQYTSANSDPESLYFRETDKLFRQFTQKMLDLGFSRREFMNLSNDLKLVLKDSDKFPDNIRSAVSSESASFCSTIFLN